ncbi:MAG: hypothetical protein IJD60_09665 [Clostridia bacterium]|nr:hypothetical protein [Clostridia bacterium]
MVKRCFLFGHADAPSQICDQLEKCIEKYIVQYHVTEFYCGNHGSFDRIAFRCLSEIKKRYPYITRILVTPYHLSDQMAENQEMADEVYYPFEKQVMAKYAIIKANHQMIDTCDFLIAYVCQTGKARDFLAYAQRQSNRRNLHIENIAQ